MNKFSRDLVKSMGEACEHSEGKRDGAGRAVLLRQHRREKPHARFHGRDLLPQHPRLSLPRVHVVEVPNVRAIRRKLRMSQTEFAQKYRIPLPTLKNWEQGRRQPDAPAAAYLHAIAMRPREVSEALTVV